MYLPVSMTALLKGKIKLALPAVHCFISSDLKEQLQFHLFYPQAAHASVCIQTGGHFFSTEITIKLFLCKL